MLSPKALAKKGGKWDEPFFPHFIKITIDIGMPDRLPEVTKCDLVCLLFVVYV